MRSLAVSVWSTGAETICLPILILIFIFWVLPEDDKWTFKPEVLPTWPVPAVSRLVNSMRPWEAVLRPRTRIRGTRCCSGSAISP
jgi:hypothetical protein